jgi:hypothetical protein
VLRLPVHDVPDDALRGAITALGGEWDGDDSRMTLLDECTELGDQKDSPIPGFNIHYNSEEGMELADGLFGIGIGTINDYHGYPMKKIVEQYQQLVELFQTIGLDPDAITLDGFTVPT